MTRCLVTLAMFALLALPLVAGAEEEMTMPPAAPGTATPFVQDPAVDTAEWADLLVKEGAITPQEESQPIPREIEGEIAEEQHVIAPHEESQLIQPRIAIPDANPETLQ